MPIVGDRPETGVRITIERDKAKEDPPWRYTGAVHLPDGSFPAVVVVEAEGAVDVTVEGGGGIAPRELGELTEKVRLIVRTAYRQAAADGEPPAWRLVRWRGEK